jgi:ferredoxin--NADP+ reductase
MARIDEALPIRHYGTVVCLGVFRGIWAIAPLAKDLRDAGNRIVSILGAKVELDLLWEEAIRLVSDEVIVSALDGSRGKPRHVGHPLLDRLSEGDVDLVVAIGPMEEVERLGGIVEARGCAFVALPLERYGPSDNVLGEVPSRQA